MLPSDFTPEIIDDPTKPKPSDLPPPAPTEIPEPKSPQSPPSRIPGPSRAQSSSGSFRDPARASRHRRHQTRKRDGRVKRDCRANHYSAG